MLVSCSAGNGIAGGSSVETNARATESAAGTEADGVREGTETLDPTENMTPYEIEIYNAHKRSVLYEGSGEMKSAIAEVIGRASRGERVSLVTFGDSITLGAGADTGKGWSDIVYGWFEALDGDPGNGNVVFTNAGIGSTELVYGVSRVSRDVLSADPDIVIVDFGTNDVGLPYAVEAYEGIFTKLVSAGIPVISSHVCPRSGANIQEKQTPVNKAYGVPQLSFKSAFYELSGNTQFENLGADSIWSADNVHPTNVGHALYADMVISYFEKYIIAPGIVGGKLSGALPKPVTGNGFSRAEFVDASSDSGLITVEKCDGWTDDYKAKLLQISSSGWQTSETGSQITFRVCSGSLHVMFACSKKTAYADVYVDGVKTGQINWGYSESKWMTIYCVYHGLGEGPHTVEFRLVDSPKTENDWFGICGFGILAENS